MGFKCRDCDEIHDELPMSFHAEMPQAWMEISEDEEDERGLLSSEQCEIDGQRFFMRGLLRVPVQGMDESLDWGVWFELDQETYQRFCDLWEQNGREKEPLHSALLATRLPTFLYPDTLGMPVQVRTMPVGERPEVLVTADHPLAADQKSGISKAKLEEIWTALLHEDNTDDEDTLEDE
jgi:hypothetical protein